LPPYNQLSRRARLQVDRRLGELRQQLVSVPLFVERRLQQVCLVRVAQLARIGPGATVTGHLVMLDVLRCRDQPGVENFRSWLLADELPGLLDESFHSDALLSPRAHLEVSADALDAIDVLFGHRLVLLESLFELGV
jgi:hypothetical protein